MAKEEHLEALKKGVAFWNKWRHNNPGLPDLRGADLLEANLEEANLRGADLGYSALCNANLIGADLREVYPKRKNGNPINSIRRNHQKRSFAWGGLLFGIVPIELSIIGIIASNPAQGISLPDGTGVSITGIATVVKLLPIWATVFFVIMLLTRPRIALDSGLCAASSLYVIDMEKHLDTERELLRKEWLGLELDDSDPSAKVNLDHSMMRRMFGIAAFGLITAYIVQHLFTLDRIWWIFSGVATFFVVSTIMSVFWDRLIVKGAFFGILTSLAGMVVFVSGSWVQSDIITVVSAVGIVTVNLAFCLGMKRETPWADAEP